MAAAVGFATALLVGAVLTPTDPVIAGSITTGTIARRLVPSRVRFALAAESGANDGAAYAFVTLPLMALLEHGPSSWDTLVMDGLLRGVLLACVVGFAIGALAGGLQWLAEKAWRAEGTTLRALPIALALLTLGALKLVGSDGILGVFLAGVAFNVIVARGGERERQQEERQEQVQEMANNLVSWPAFLVFGTLLPWGAWSDHLTALVLLSLAILLLRRPPWFYLLERPLTRSAGGAADRLFLGWFGPIGMAAIFYALHARGHHQPEVWVYASFVVVASVVVHGVSATPGTRWYGRRAGEPERRAEDG